MTEYFIRLYSNLMICLGRSQLCFATTNLLGAEPWSANSPGEETVVKTFVEVCKNILT